MSYRSAWKRFRWRHGGNWDWLSTLNVVHYPVVALCWLEWLHPGSIAPILVQISSAVWLTLMVLLLLAHPFIWLVNRQVAATTPRFPENVRLMKWFGFGGIPGLFSMGLQTGELWMFLRHHLDGALLCGSLWSLFFILKNGWDRKDSNAILRACVEALLVMAALFHSGGLAVVWAVASPLANLLLRPSLTAYLHGKFSRDEAAQEIRRSIDARPWPNLKDKVDSGLWWFRAYELWEDAGQWLQDYKESDALSPIEQERWQTMIAIGKGQYELAPELERLLPQSEQKDERRDEIRVIATAYARLGKREEALRVINNRAGLRPRERSHSLADVHTILGEWEMALRYYEALDRNPDTLYGMATCLTRLGYQREARELYRQAIILSMYVRLDYLRDLAVCCRRIGDDRMASEAERLIFEKGG